MAGNHYTVEWAEQQFARLEQGKLVSKDDRYAMLLVYRTNLRLAMRRMRSASSAARENADWLERQVEEPFRVVERDGVWRWRDDDGIERDLTDEI